MGCPRSWPQVCVPRAQGEAPRGRESVARVVGGDDGKPHTKRFRTQAEAGQWSNAERGKVVTNQWISPARDDASQTPSASARTTVRKAVCAAV